MSNPLNPLSKYRSYSYYHVLAVCDSSETASELAGSTMLDAWQHPSGTSFEFAGASVLGKYAPKEISTTSGNGQYCILINGSTDAAFTITKAHWSSYSASSATMNDRGTSIALEGSISISEPRGIMFLDQVVRCCLELGVDSASAFWVLKTFFVGYTYDTQSDKDTVDYISDTPPVIFIAYDVVGTFGVTGGEYEINFLAAANSAARLPHFSKSEKAINIKAKNTFAETLAALEVDVNENYKRYFNCVKAQVDKIKGSENLSASLREVKYIITCGYPYMIDGKPTSGYTVSDQAVQLKDVADCSSAANVNVSAGVSIEDAIHRIIGMCPGIKQEADEGIGGIKYIPKIHSWVNSVSTGNGDNKKLAYTVGYRVERQVQPHSISFEGATGGANIASFGTNLIEYDYIYTGKNIDILEFDIKMNMGMVYLQGMTISNPYRQPNQKAATSATNLAGIDIQTRQNGQNIPVFFGTNIKTASIRDTQDSKATSQFNYSMSKHASLESIEASIKITGNPALLGSINATTDPSFINDPNRVVTPLQDDGYARFSEWTLSPSFAKINIKMPRNNDDLSLFTGGSQTSTDKTAESNDYAVDFWFSGYYFIYGIDHTFDNGEFSQTLQALGIPEKDSFKQQKDSTVAQNVTLDTNVQSCYDNYIGCGSTASSTGENTGTSSASGVVPEDNECTQTEAAKMESHIYVPSNTKLSDIAGYNGIHSTNDVKQAIHNAAVKHNVREEDLALMISYESNFNATVVNSSGYRGLGQFGKGTWYDMGGTNFFGNGPSSPLDPYTNADLTAKYMVHNKKAFQENVSAQEPTVLDLYTMHQRGTTGGLRVLKHVYNGTGDQNAGLSEETVIKNRLPPNPSYNDVYNSYIIALGKRKKSGLPVANSTRNALPPLRNSSGNISESSASNNPKARDALAAYSNCKDDEKKKQDPAKNTNCSKEPTNNLDATTSSAGTTNNGQAASNPNQQVLIKNTTGETITKQQASSLPTDIIQHNDIVDQIPNTPPA